MPTDDMYAIELLGRPLRTGLGEPRALPFTAVTRHLVLDGRLTLRLHRGHGYHQALDGSVVAYQADNAHSAACDTWSVQVTGTARVHEPTPASATCFGQSPLLADGEPYESGVSAHRAAVRDGAPPHGRPRLPICALCVTLSGKPASRPVVDLTSGACCAHL